MTELGTLPKDAVKNSGKFSEILNNLSIHAYSKLVEQHKNNFNCGRCGLVPENVCYISHKCPHIFCEMCVKEDPFFGICPTCGEAIQQEDLVLDPRYWVFYEFYKRTCEHQLPRPVPSIVSKRVFRVMDRVKVMNCQAFAPLAVSFLRAELELTHSVGQFQLSPEEAHSKRSESLAVHHLYTVHHPEYSFRYYGIYVLSDLRLCSGKPISADYLNTQKPQKYNFLLQEECRKLFTRNSAPYKNGFDFENIKLLLNYGANPNVLNKDGWTLMHEAVDYSHVEVLQLLLLGGGLVNAYSLDRFTTCLHDALEEEHVNMRIINILLAHGADIEARDRTGLTAKKKAEMKKIDLVAYAESVPRYIDIDVMYRPEDTPLLYGCQLSADKQKILNDFSQKFKIKQSPRSKVTKEVTHIIVESDPCKPSFAVNFGILQGCYILTFAWIKECLKLSTLLPSAPYEVKGTKAYPNTGVPRKSRLNSALLQPKLFAGGQFNIFDNSNRLSPEEKEEVVDLISAGGGKVLTRANSCGESIGQSFFYHAHGGPLQNCTVIVLHKTEPRNKSWEAIGHFSLKWLYKAIQTFQIVP